MSRYRGPSCKLCRRSREKLFLKGDRCFTAKCEIEKRNFPPGPRATMMRKISEFGRRLREKQKLRWFYGVSEKAIRRYFKEASRQKGITGHNLLVLFETRFDNILYRSNIARSRKEARQMIRHGHFAVNNKKMDIPSFIAKEGDVININPKSLEWIKDRFSAVKEKGLPSWIGFDESKSLVTVLQRPQRTEIDVPVEEQLIIEYYSR